MYNFLAEVTYMSDPTIEFAKQGHTEKILKKYFYWFMMR